MTFDEMSDMLQMKYKNTPLFEGDNWAAIRNQTSCAPVTREVEGIMVSFCEEDDGRSYVQIGSVASFGHEID